MSVAIPTRPTRPTWPTALQTSNILEPELGMLGDEGLHHPDASRILDDVDAHASRSQEVLLAQKRAVPADDDVRDAVEKDRAAAHGARRERRVHRARAINGRRLAA